MRSGETIHGMVTYQSQCLRLVQVTLRALSIKLLDFFDCLLVPSEASFQLTCLYWMVTFLTPGIQVPFDASRFIRKVKTTTRLAQGNSSALRLLPRFLQECLQNTLNHPRLP